MATGSDTAAFERATDGILGFFSIEQAKVRKRLDSQREHE
jgi:hypothetical protein